MNEVWKDIEGSDGAYSISNIGRVMSNSTVIRRKRLGSYKRNSFIKKQTVIRKGYMVVTLSIKGKHSQYLVHRLVAAAFIPNTEHKPQVNHIDGNKQNNCVSNLEWVTGKENMIHASKHGLLNTHNPLNKKAVLMFDLKGNFIREYESKYAASRDLRINHVSIYNVIRGRFRQTHGYIFKHKLTI